MLDITGPMSSEKVSCSTNQSSEHYPKCLEGLSQFANMKRAFMFLLAPRALDEIKEADLDLRRMQPTAPQMLVWVYLYKEVRNFVRLVISENFYHQWKFSLFGDNGSYCGSLPFQRIRNGFVTLSRLLYLENFPFASRLSFLQWQCVVLVEKGSIYVMFRFREQGCI